MPQYFSPVGLEKLKKELEDRRGEIRTDITRRILAAKELGDLSENAEYAEAKEAQAFNEGKIAELEDTIKEGIVINHKEGQGVIVVGSTMKLKSGPVEHKFTIVGPAESDPVKGFISNESPLGQAFIGHKKGDEVQVKTPGGIVKYKILEVA